MGASLGRFIEENGVTLPGMGTLEKSLRTETHASARAGARGIASGNNRAQSPVGPALK